VAHRAASSRSLGRLTLVDLVHGLTYGFSVCFTPANLFACFVGVFVGTLIGVLPGIGPVATMSLLLPITFTMSPTASIIMMAGIYYGAVYGGSTTSILVNIPGEAASVVTCIDGYQMARQGRAGPALGIAAFGSFIAGTFSVVMLMLLSPPLAAGALRFGPPEIFTLLLLGFTMITYLGSGSRRLERLGGADRARQPARVRPRHPARRRRDHPDLRVVRAREAPVADARALRPRRDRGRGRAGVRQQRGDRGVDDPAPHARHR